MRYLTYLGQTNALVAQAVAEWNDAEATYADYAALLAGAEGPLMPRRGEHHAVRAAKPAAVTAAGTQPGGQPEPDLRIGVRVVQSRIRDTVASYRVDPQAYACPALAAQLADEWVRYARAAALADGSRYAAHRSVHQLHRPVVPGGGSRPRRGPAGRRPRRPGRSHRRLGRSRSARNTGRVPSSPTRALSRCSR